MELTIEMVREWMKAAQADGWTVTDDRDPMLVSLAKPADGDDPWKALLTMRPAHSDRRGEYPKWDIAGIAVWGPDRLAIKPPFEYDWQALLDGLRTCHACGATDVETQRYSFAGRCCAVCRPEMARIHERQGWTS